MTKKSKQDSLLIGQSFPIGPTLKKNGVNFCLFSKNAVAVDLLLFDDVEDIEPKKIISLDPSVNRTYHYWHVFVPAIKSGQLYGYRVSGPDDPSLGHRFDAEKVLLDPYAKAVAFPKDFKRGSFTGKGKVAVPSLKSVVCYLSGYDWNGDRFPNRSFAQTVIYEMHVGGFTKNPNSGVSKELSGTYRGLIEKIPYLVELGITAVELLPIFQFDAQDCPDGLVNYWGYSPISFFAPHQAYGTDSNPVKVLDDFRDMVKALHRAGIEVILDVVFNHTAEGNHNGPNYCFRGIDNDTYYILEDDKSRYANYTGTGNTLNANNAIVRRMILDSLQFWVKHMHVDGFRFDLASILSRDNKGRPIENPPILWDIESDPVLAGTKLIAEAWDAAGLYQVGSFIGDSWKEWNGRFRDDVRSFMRGDSNTVSAFATRTIGSPDLYEKDNLAPEQSINFVTCHDGFTLNDLVSYNSKHNDANGEGNRDGSDNNLSWNCGVEGPTEDLKIEALRNRQAKNFMAITLWSIGAPMILMGDEVRRTQNGNNNAYCQDNELNWFDWDLTKKHPSLFRFVKILLACRLNRDMSKKGFNMNLKQFLATATINWHGVELNKPDWSENSHSIAFTVKSLDGRRAMHYIVNAYNEPLEFELPKVDVGSSKKWNRWMDTSLESPDDICLLQDAKPVAGATYKLSAHSIAILLSYV
ncbi:MAG TPA: glycogen debranching protein GlgX [Cyclobacteriaceae bacterium]|jgi:glycogen operon protein|nr:glycogen debranching protein GlgX [Cyclobacteriaceae bacterium]